MSKKFNKIKKWVDKQGYAIRFGKSDFVDYDKKEVVLLRNQKDKFLIYSALHECGHVIIGTHKSYYKKYKAIERALNDARHEKSDVYKYARFREEIDAWEQGYKLSKKLQLSVDKDDYDKYAAKCFKTYIKYT